MSFGKPLVLAALLLALLVCLPAALAEESLYSRIIDVPSAGPLQYYAQNDPEWARSVYEPYRSSNCRPFGSSGCGPTAAAIAIARQVPADRLNGLLSSAANPEKGFPYCPCSVNNYTCDRTHEATYPTTAEDFRSHLPVIFGSFAAGNNSGRELFRKEHTTTSLGVFSALARAYVLHYRSTREWKKARVALEAGCSVITTVTAGAFTSSSHYLFLASVDDGYVYVLDPLMRESYDTLDKKHLLEVVEPGLVRARLSSLSSLNFSGFYIISDEEIVLE